MAEQTTIEPCWFCGEPSVEETVLRPSTTATDKAGKRITTLALKGWVCSLHKQHIEQSDDWQSRERRRRSEESKALKKDQLALGDEAA